MKFGCVPCIRMMRIGISDQSTSNEPMNPPGKGFTGFLLYRKVFLPAYLCSCINALYSHVTNVTITQNLILCLFDLMLRVKSVKFSSVFKPT